LFHLYLPVTKKRIRALLGLPIPTFWLIIWFIYCSLFEAATQKES